MSLTATERPGPAARILYALPVVGRFAKDAGKSEQALIFAVVNIVMLWVLAGFLWGIDGVLAVALVLAPTVLIAISAMFLSGGKMS